MNYDTPIIDPRPLSPPDEPEDFTQVDEVLINGSFGIFIPQMFVQKHERLGDVSEYAWERCWRGPNSDAKSDEENYDYYDAWSEVLDNWNYLSYEGCGNTYKYFLDQSDGNGDLYLMRQLIDHETDLD